jgi:signal transduction histidine kinase
MTKDWAMLAIAGIGLAASGIVAGAVVATRKARDRQRRAELALEAVRRTNEELQQAQQARTAMLGMASHELRTPLSKILAAAELIELVAEGEDVKQATAELYAAVETMTEQLNDLGAFSKLSYARASERDAELYIREALNEIAQAQALQARAHKNEVQVDVAGDVPYRLAINATGFGQIATNLVSNAVKYTRDGLVRIVVRIAKQDRHMLELIVADSGQGISAADQDLIWEPFYRADSAKESGSGLGLAVVKLAVEKLGGSVTLQSACNVGSTFIVRLPLPA